MPLEMAASSSPEVHTYWPFLAMTMAVPVSWQLGRIMPARVRVHRVCPQLAGWRGPSVEVARRTRSDVGVLEELEGHEAVVVGGLRVLEDVVQLLQVGRPALAGKKEEMMMMRKTRV